MNNNIIDKEKASCILCETQSESKDLKDGLCSVCFERDNNLSWGKIKQWPMNK